MKLMSYRRKDQVHLLDMFGNRSHRRQLVSQLPLELAPRLQHLIDTPEG